MNFKFLPDSLGKGTLSNNCKCVSIKQQYKDPRSFGMPSSTTKLNLQYVPPMQLADGATTGATLHMAHSSFPLLWHNNKTQFRLVVCTTKYCRQCNCQLFLLNISHVNKRQAKNHRVPAVCSKDVKWPSARVHRLAALFPLSLTVRFCMLY